jgi:hypothetical protein
MRNTGLFGAILASLITICTAAQTSEISSFDQESTIKSMANGRMFQSFDNRFKGLEGSPTLFGEYVPGKIILSDGQVFRHSKMNYDAYNSDLLVIKDGKEMVVSIRNVKDFVLMTSDEEDSLIFTRLLTDENKLGFYEVLAKQKNATLFKKHYKILREPTYTGAYSPGQHHSELLDAKKIMMRCTGKQLAELKTKKQLYEYLPEFKSVLQEYVRKEKIDLSDEADLIKLFGKIDELHVTRGS